MDAFVVCPTSQSFQTNEVIFTAVSFSSNPRIIRNYSLTLSPNSDGVLCVEMSGEFISQFSRTTIYMKGKKKSNPKSKSYDQEVISATVDACKIERGVRGNFLVKVILDQLQGSTFRFDCVAKMGPFNTGQLLPPRDDLVPYTLLGLTDDVIYWEFTSVSKAKVKNTKGFTYLSTIRIEGETRRGH